MGIQLIDLHSMHPAAMVGWRLGSDERKKTEAL
jgi:hypothetical protein